MFLSIKKLQDNERDICFRTLSPKAIFAIVGDAIQEKKGMSIIRMGDGEVGLLKAPNGKEFHGFDYIDPEWNIRMGIAGLEIEKIKENILKAGNESTYFAPSVSGISLGEYSSHNYFNSREFYFDNFFVNDWGKGMIRMLLEASDGIFIIHKEFEFLIENFVTHYKIPRSKFAGFQKKSWRDNDQAVQEAIKSGKQLILFSAGPAGKIIGPEIAKAGRVVLDVGNTLVGWSLGNPRN